VSVSSTLSGDGADLFLVISLSINPAIFGVKRAIMKMSIIMPSIAPPNFIKTTASSLANAVIFKLSPL
jgi:hypothetical protein